MILKLYSHASSSSNEKLTCIENSTDRSEEANLQGARSSAECTFILVTNLPFYILFYSILCYKLASKFLYIANHLN